MCFENRLPKRATCLKTKFDGVDSVRPASFSGVIRILSDLEAYFSMPEDILIPSLMAGESENGLNNLDSIAWESASILCRFCWHPWWKHGHGPFSSLVDKPVAHLFDAL